MIEVFTAMGVVLVVVTVVELIAAGRWSPSYFRSGIRLFRKTVPYGGQLTGPELLDALNWRFRGRVWPPLRFRQIGANEYAFREKIIQICWITYTPVMHGLVRVGEDSATVTGYANWWPLLFFLLFVCPAVADIGGYGGIFVFGGLLLFTLIYGTQARRFNQVGKYLCSFQSAR